MSSSSEGVRVVQSLMSKVQDDLRRQADEHIRNMPDRALVGFSWWLEVRQWDLQVIVSTVDDPLESAKLRGAVEEIQFVLDSIASEAVRRHQSQKDAELEVSDE